MADEKRATKRQKAEVGLHDVSEETCCLKIDGPRKPASDVLSDYPALLQNLLAPLDHDVFLQKCFRNCAVHIQGSVDRFESILKEHLFDLDPLSIFAQTSSENIFVWLKMPDELIHSIEVADPNTALALHQAGNATYCRAPPELERVLVPALLQDTGLGCGQYNPDAVTSLGRGEVEVLISTDKHCTDWHTDFQENFTLQLSGIKKWTLQKGTVKHPMRGCTPHYNSPESVEPQLKAARLADPSFQFGKPAIGKNAVGDVETVILKPGDVLYHPAGMWHKVETLEKGVSINISLMATTYAAITCRSLEHLLLKRDEWRQCIRNDGSVVDTLKSLLKELPGIIQDFERNGGAHAILPPVLLNGNMKRAEGDEEDEDEDDEEESRSAQQEEEMYDTIDADAFQSPSGAITQLVPNGTRMKLEINPLAVLLDEHDIQSYYNDEEENGNGKDESARVFVLNVNYAGTESQESCVRVRLKTCHFQKLSKLLSDDPIEIPAQLRPLVDFLTHYGYLYWKTK
jgi:hypothetical protein